MELQQGISLEKNQRLVGKTLQVLIEGQGEVENEDGTPLSDQAITLGRSYRDAPEIDGMVIIEGQIPVGEMVPVRISGAMAYDLTGTVEWRGSTAHRAQRWRMKEGILVPNANLVGYASAIQAACPEIDIQSLSPVDEGWSSFVVEARTVQSDQEWIFRFPRRPEIVMSLEMEIVAASLPGSRPAGKRAAV